MPIANDLLEQAEHLIRRERLKPRQASLRRGISNAYYAIFHLLSSAAAEEVAKGRSAQMLVKRAVDHSEMRDVCRQFASGGLPVAVRSLLPGPLPDGLRVVAEGFSALQQARHEADYDLTRAITRIEALAALDETRRAFQEWAKVRKTNEAHVFLLALMFGRRWQRN